MVESFKYRDKNIDTIKKDVETEFKSIDKRGQRDDKEIFQSGINICSKYIKEIQKDEAHNNRALEPLTKLQRKIQGDINKLQWYSYMTNNKDKIHSVAHDIDNAEYEILKRLEKNRTDKQTENIVTQSTEKRKWSPLFQLDDNKNLTFTKASNPIRIDQALSWLFDNPDVVYQIDYSNCTNSRIKNKMVSLIWSQTCYLRYDKEKRTYTLRDKDGNWISNRAYIREWVKLIPDGVRRWDAYQEQKKANENLWTLDESKYDVQTQAMLKDMPSARALSDAQRENLMLKTENRIIQLLKKAKEHGYELKPECISKKQIGKWLMELHLISWTSEVDWLFWENDSILQPDLYKFLDEHEKEYKTYLTNRVKQKRQELDSLTKTERVDVSGESEWWDLEIQEKSQMLHWISLLQTMVENFRQSEWNSWMDIDDRNLSKMGTILRNWKKSIEDSNNVSKQAIIDNVINPFRRLWKSFSLKNLASQWNAVTQASVENDLYNKLNLVFFWQWNEQISSIRALWSYWRLLNKTETSFLQQELESWSELEVNDENINEYLKNIDTIFNLYDESWDVKDEESKKFLDGMFSAAATSTDELIRWLEGNKILPPTRKKKEKQFRKQIETLKNQLGEREKLLNNFPQTKESIARQNHEEKLRLQQKNNKTEEEIQRLQALEYLESNPEAQEEISTKTINTLKTNLKYWNIWQLTKWCLLSSFAEIGWWAKWNNADIYNDIIWYWFFNLSDKNAKLVWDIAKEIAITVAIAVVTWWMWSAAIAWLLNVCARWANAAKRVNLAHKIAKIVNITQTAYKELSIWAKAVKLWITATSLLLEGTIFNAASNVVHSAVNWTSLDNLNLNPVARENIQTAAFLGALSISGKLTQWLVKAWWKTKLAIKLVDWLEKAHLQAPAKFTLDVVTEMWTMLAAEQVINFTFGHDVIDSETWEIRKERFHAPTQEEIIQMVWMIIAFKMVKPSLWHNIEKKLNEWTLEICRWTGKNEIVLRDPKTWKTEKLQNLIEWGGDLTRQDNIDLQRKQQELYDEFDTQALSKEWITIDWHNYRLEYRSNTTANAGRKWEFVRIKDWKVVYSANAETGVLPNNSNWNRIRNQYEALRQQYIDNWLASYVRHQWGSQEWWQDQQWGWWEWQNREQEEQQRREQERQQEEQQRRQQEEQQRRQQEEEQQRRQQEEEQQRRSQERQQSRQQTEQLDINALYRKLSQKFHPDHVMATEASLYEEFIGRKMTEKESGNFYDYFKNDKWTTEAAAELQKLFDDIWNMYQNWNIQWLERMYNSSKFLQDRIFMDIKNKFASYASESHKAAA